jgi:hypothetical protein
VTLAGERSKIWIASATDGVLTSLVAPGSRDAVRDYLLARQRIDTPCLVGLDFAFSFPAWYASSRGWTHARDVWTAVRDDGETWLSACAPPFWGRAGAKRPHELHAGLRDTERRWPLSAQPKSVFQLGGAGAVGTGSIRGMPMLLALQQAGWSIWPFDAPSTHTLLEIYPRLFTGPVVKRDPASRSAYLTTQHVTRRKAFINAMAASEDAFDAGVSAVAMSRAATVAPLADVSDAVAQIEGRAPMRATISGL